MVLLGVTLLWHVAQWVSRAPPHHTLPSLLNLNGTSNMDHVTWPSENLYLCFSIEFFNKFTLPFRCTFVVYQTLQITFLFTVRAFRFHNFRKPFNRIEVFGISLSKRNIWIFVRRRMYWKYGERWEEIILRNNLTGRFTCYSFLNTSRILAKKII